ncbi:glycoside hydrolase family 88 protein [Pseudoflavitalea sp. G-6-1-2]|uniref:glycoside hydrolase family 88/105 protein n=1 Tax=Pseudoflavitalea sp. G-6-1-2 TaxID=2728841 RepID=UPI00146C81CB|nr:glycoside hydrolase family 88 protein [Pseudoflavitalea sp. G-6-1-2]NML22196.1 glycoside hydrolase family 88 protein [Pseudoflavitalea sp. G-6-1-2]
MKRFLLSGLAALSTCSAAIAQTTPAQTEAIVRKVADNIIRSTSFKFVNSKTGETFASTKGKDTSGNVKADSKFNKWMYVNGVLTVGMVRMTEVLKDQAYLDYSKKNFSFIFDNLDYFKKQYDAGNKNVEYRPVFRMGSLDDCGAMAAGLLDLYPADKRADYMAYLKRVSTHIIEKQSKFPDGTLARTGPRNMTLWADDLYMSVPYIARMGKFTGEQSYFDFAIKQVEQFNKYIYDSATGLYFHTFYNDENMNGVAHWGRCNGWVALAQVELLNNLPANHPKRPELIRLLQRQIVGFSRYQDIDGMWHQLVDKPDSYAEASVTAMYVYAVAKAVNEGWINKRFISIAQNGWDALAKKVTADGQVEDICIGTSVEEDIRYYYTRPKETNDTHGLGAFLMAGAEMLRAKDKLVDINKRR